MCACMCGTCVHACVHAHVNLAPFFQNLKIILKEMTSADWSRGLRTMMMTQSGGVQQEQVLDILTQWRQKTFWKSWGYDGGREA